jgi:hypothetical protein
LCKDASNVPQVFQADFGVTFRELGQLGDDFRMERKQLGAREIEQFHQ